MLLTLETAQPLGTKRPSVLHRQPRVPRLKHLLHTALGLVPPVWGQPERTQLCAESAGPAPAATLAVAAMLARPH